MSQKPFNGKTILEALSEFKEPVTLDEIVDYVAEVFSKTPDQVRQLVEEALDGGVRYGYVQKHNDHYYRLSDAVDALVSSDEEGEAASVDSFGSIDSNDHDEVPESQHRQRTSKPILPRAANKKPSRTKKPEGKKTEKGKEKAKRERPFGRHFDDEIDHRREKYAKRRHNGEPKREKHIQEAYDDEVDVDSEEEEYPDGGHDYERSHHSHRDYAERPYRSRSSRRRY